MVARRAAAARAAAQRARVHLAERAAAGAHRVARAPLAPPEGPKAVTPVTRTAEPDPRTSSAMVPGAARWEVRHRETRRESSGSSSCSSHGLVASVARSPRGSWSSSLVDRSKARKEKRRAFLLWKARRFGASIEVLRAAQQPSSSFASDTLYAWRETSSKVAVRICALNAALLLWPGSATGSLR